MQKLLLLIFFLVISTLSYSQTWKELNNQVLNLCKTKKYAAALPIALAAKDSAQSQFGIMHRNYATSLNNLAEVYRELSQYEKAEELLVKSLQVRKEIVGEAHQLYASSLNNLASLYETMGQYEKAEPLYLRAIEIDKKVLGEKHPDYISDLSNLAGLYRQVGQYEKAEILYLRVVEADKLVLGENHPDYASDLSNLALLYGKMGRYQKAESLFKQALQIEKKLSGANLPNDATVINNLASLYHRQDDLTKAEPLYMEAVAITKRMLGDSHPEFATTLNNLALVYKEKGRYDLAEPLYLQSKEIRKKTLGEKHIAYAESLNNLAELYQSTGNFTMAEQLIVQSSRIEIENMQKNFTALSEREKINYLKRNIALLPANNSFLYKNRKATSALVISNFNQQLIFKSLILSDTRNLFQAAAQTKDTAIKNLLVRWQSNKAQLAKEYSLPVSKRIATVADIEGVTETLEKELNRKFSTFRIQQQKLQITAKNIKDNLQNQEVAIEFVSFRFFNNKLTDSTIYAAYILNKKDSIPVFVPLFEEKQLQRLLDNAGDGSQTIANNFYRGFKVKTGEASHMGDSLYQLIWQPLEPYLKGAKKIAYSPAGKLNSIAFHALPVDSATLLMDKYQLQQYTCTRQVVVRDGKQQHVKPQSITLFGDANFSLDSLQLSQQKNKQPGTVSTSVYAPPTNSSEQTIWDSLPGTATEVNTIKLLFDKNKSIASSFTQTAASEENLKALSGHSPQIVHIATHGFFLPSADKKQNENSFSNENTYTVAEDPLLRSGLILSGGNYVWSGKMPVEGVEDGIVTAYEISQLNLSNTELVVLSACETALGDVKGSEGVFGLQRAFKMAGVKKMIVSLWQVPDKETAELMSSFYSYWIKGKTIQEAFSQAQSDMRKKYSPFYWAAFVLVE